MGELHDVDEANVAFPSFDGANVIAVRRLNGTLSGIPSPSVLATLEACVDSTLLRPILLIESASVRAIFLPSSTDGTKSRWRSC